MLDARDVMRHRFPLAVGLLLTVQAWALADSYTLNTPGSRVWVGPECVALPMQDWSVKDGVLLGQAAEDRMVSLMACETSGDADFHARASVEFTGQADQSAKVVGGFIIGTRDEVGDWRRRALFPQQGVRVGINAQGYAVIDDTLSDKSLNMARPIDIEIAYDAKLTTLSVTAQSNRQRVSAQKKIDPQAVAGGVALIAQAPRKRPNAQGQDAMTWQFQRVTLDGGGIHVHPDRTFGPILWSQYTLSDRTLKMNVQMPPIGQGDAQSVTLETDLGHGWQHAADAPIDPDARTALFRIENWPSEKDVPYRVVYPWDGQTSEWVGTIRKDPVSDKQFKLAVFSCDNGYAFPATRIVQAVRMRDPDMMFFAGDQIYEVYGGYGITRWPVEDATLDYFRKWYQFGWTWRELLRDRPSVIIPDDHDVYQGNLWGNGGTLAPKGKNDNWGGYIMAPRWVNMVQRTQTANLPDPVDPKPTPSGIGVYFTALNYAGGRLAIIEDRKFKSGPGIMFQKHGIKNASELDGTALDFDDASLLGDRQLAFLENWGRSSDSSPFNIILSQTMFAQVHTHGGPKLNRSRRDVDTNGWPSSKRNEALTVIEKTHALLLCGDQHFGALVRHGIKDFGDGPLQFMVPGTVNGWPRAAWPGVEENNPEKVDGNPLGKRTDPFGNKIDVLGVGNPTPRSNVNEYDSPDDKARAKGSGFGMVTLDKPAKQVTFELLRYPAADGQPADSFEGFPITMPLGGR